VKICGRELFKGWLFTGSLRYREMFLLDAGCEGAFEGYYRLIV